MGNILRKQKSKTKNAAVDTNPVELVSANTPTDRKMTNNIEVQNNTAEVQNFKKWEKIVPELKRNAISYFDGETQFNYAQCSKLCNDEIQKLDKRVPVTVKMGSLDEECTNIFIHVYFHNLQTPRLYGYEMKFINVENNKHKWIVRPYSEYRLKVYNYKESTRVFQLDENATYSGTAWDGARRYVEHRIRFSSPKTKSFLFELITASWPNQLSSFLRLFHKDHQVIGQWTVHLNDQIYEAFMAFIKDNPISSNISLKCGRAENQFIIPPSFFDSNLFKNVDEIDCTAFTITDEQFLQTKARDLSLYTTNITSEAVHQKLFNWFNDATSVDDTSIHIVGHWREPHYWDRRTIIGNLPFRQQDDNNYIIQKGGITMELSFCYIIRTVLYFRPCRTKYDTDDE